jgi:membrane associated rhomboid family serine protease
MKKKLRFSIGAPVTLFIFVATLVILILDECVFKGKATQNIFSCPAAKGESIFRFTVPINYFRLILHPFGQNGLPIFFADCALLLSLGRQSEELYGKPVLIIMAIFSSLVAGVLNACLGNCLMLGLSPLIFTLILLSLGGFKANGTVYLPNLILLILYLTFQIYLSLKSPASYAEQDAGKIKDFFNHCIPALISFAGGVAGSLFAFLSTKGKSSRKGRIRNNGDTTEVTL